MQIKESVPLLPYLTFKVGGEARYFISVKSVSDLKEAVQFAASKKIPFYVLGEGSNLLAKDEGFKGLVIKNEIRGIKMKETPDGFLLEAGAGENWDDFVAFTVAHGFYGLENLSYIPGTVGAAPVQNIGAYGSEVKETIKEVEVFDAEELSLKTFSNEDCKFEYRDSIFKKKEGRHFIITKVTFLLSKSGRVNIGYKDVKAIFKDRYSKDVTPKEVREAIVSIRKEKLPDWKVVNTAGSFFKNPFVTEKQYEKLKESFPELPGFKEGKKVKIPLAWIFDKVLNLRGFSEGNVGLYEKQPLAVVNKSGATFSEIQSFAARIADLIEEKTGIKIEWEVRVME